MCPEPDFCFQYRELISYYRLTPEVSAKQLDVILAQLSARRARMAPPAAKPCQKGGDPQ